MIALFLDNNVLIGYIFETDHVGLQVKDLFLITGDYTHIVPRRNLEPLINEATNIKIHRGSGRPPSLDLKQSVIILLLKELIGESNRKMASMLAL